MKYIELLVKEMKNMDYLGCSETVDWLRENGAISFNCHEHDSCIKCNREMIEALNKEVVIVNRVTKLEYLLMEHCVEQGFYYCAREKDVEEIYLYDKEPTKLVEADMWEVKGIRTLRDFSLFDNLFQFVQWEDDEATDFREVLKNCEVIDDE